jgi:hypothetical protein
MLSSSDNRKVPQSMNSRELCGLIDWWTAQVIKPQQPPDRDGTDRAGSYDGNGLFVSAPRPPPTTINKIKAPRMTVRNL